MMGSNPVSIGVVGTGHVGLVTAAALANAGHKVAATDADEKKLRSLHSGILPFFEPGLEDLVRGVIQKGSLQLAPDIASAVHEREVVFVCVGTPPRETGEANLVAVEKAVREIVQHASPPCVIVEKSTVPTGTASRLERLIRVEKPSHHADIHVASNPEFLREGSAVSDSLRPSRILVGANSNYARGVLRRVYEPFMKADTNLVELDVVSAELAKHANNAFLATKISFVNAVARICERSGADIRSVADFMGLDQRIGPAFLDAGLGFGGSCFPKDLKAFQRLSSSLGYDFGLLREVERINDEIIDATLERLKDLLWNLAEKHVALLGLAFKPGTDDVRFSRALSLANGLVSEGAHVRGFDPVAGGNAKEVLPELSVVDSTEELASGSDCLIICTEWPEFTEIDWSSVRDLMRRPTVLDGRLMLDPSLMRNLGFDYHALGRPSQTDQEH